MCVCVCIAHTKGGMARDAKKVAINEGGEAAADNSQKNAIFGARESWQAPIRWIGDKMSNVKDFGALSIVYDTIYTIYVCV